MDDVIPRPNPQPSNQQAANQMPIRSATNFNLQRRVQRPIFSDAGRPSNSRPLMSIPSQVQQPRMDGINRPTPITSLQPRPLPLNLASAQPNPSQVQQPRTDAFSRPAPIPAQQPTTNQVPTNTEVALGNVANNNIPRPELDFAKHAREKNKSRPITKTVMIFSVSMFVLSALSLLTWLSVTKLPGINTPTFVLGLILVAAELTLGIGILFIKQLRQKIARTIYISVGLILLVFSIYGTSSYLMAVHKIDQTQKGTISALKNQIVIYQSNASLSAANKADIIRVLYGYMVVDPPQFEKEKSTILPLIENLAIASVSIVVLTRPRIKEVFND